MSIWSDLDRNAHLFRCAAMTPVHVETMRIAVQLDHGSGVGRFLDHGLDVDCIWLAREKKATGWVAEYGEAGIVHRLEDSIGHRRTVHAEPRVNRGDYIVETVECLVRVVDAPVGENIRFDTLENPEVLRLRVDPVDLIVLLLQLVALETAGVERRLRVIGNSEVAPAALTSRFRHLFDGSAAIGVSGVAVEDATDVLPRQQLRQTARCCRSYFSTSFSELGRNLRKPQRREEVLLGGAQACFPTGTGKRGICDPQIPSRGTLL